jgi:hypothetical protein
MVRTSRWERLLPAVPPLAAAFLILTLRVAQIPLILGTFLAVAGCGFIALMRLPERKGVAMAMTAAGFFAGTAIRFGLLDLADVCLIGAFGLLLLTSDTSEGAPPRRTGALVGGLLLIAAGGLLGSLFVPTINTNALRAGYAGSNLGPIPAQFADVIRFVMFTAGLILLVRAWRPSRRQATHVLFAYGAGAAVNALYGAFLGAEFAGRARGFASHPVFYGLICAFGVVVGWGITVSGGRGQRLFGLFVMGSAGVGVLQSGTRSSLLVAVLGLLIYQAANRSLRSTTALAVFALVALTVAVFGSQFISDTPTLTRLTGGGQADISNAARDEAREETNELIRHRGITGAGFRYLIPPHNLLLGIIAAAGMLGFVGFLVIALALGSHLVATARGDPLFGSVLAAGMGVLACCWVVNPGWDRWMWLPIAVVLGASTRRGAAARDDAEAATEPASWMPQ